MQASTTKTTSAQENELVRQTGSSSKASAPHFDDAEELMLQVAAGNWAATRVCATLMPQRRDIVESMLALNIVGPEVWIIFKDVAGQSMKDFISHIEKLRDSKAAKSS